MHRNNRGVSHEEFDATVEDALASLPPEFQELLENIVVIVEEEPTVHDREAHIGISEELLGSFRGVARTHRTTDMLPALPNRIAIFRGPILRVSRTREEAIDEIQKTVIHELGHYFGLDDEGMPY